jgi:hypothetical protein
MNFVIHSPCREECYTKDNREKMARLRPEPCQAHAKWGTVAHFSVHFSPQVMRSALLSAFAEDHGLAHG